MENIIPLMAALEVHSKHYHSFGDYSGTSLIDAPRIVQLKKRYGHLVPVNPERQMASFIGTGVHNYFEDTIKTWAALNDDYEVERSVFEKIDDRLVAGRFDILYRKRHIYDIKTAKTWKLIFDTEMVDWHEQQNIYAYLLRLRGFNIESLNIIAVYLDWQQNMALRDRNYPQQRVEQYRLNLWSPERQAEFVSSKLAIHKAAEDLMDEELPACTPEERWERFPGGGTVQYALLKNRNSKRAMRCVANVPEMAAYAAEKNLPSSTVVEVRHARRTRCIDWCEVAPWCNIHRQYTRDMEAGNLNEYYELGDFV